MYALENSGFWPQVLPDIQAIITNIFFSLISKKTPNKVAYDFSSYYLLDLLAMFSTLNILVA